MSPSHRWTPHGPGVRKTSSPVYRDPDGRTLPVTIHPPGLWDSPRYLTSRTRNVRDGWFSGVFRLDLTSLILSDWGGYWRVSILLHRHPFSGRHASLADSVTPGGREWGWTTWDGLPVGTCPPCRHPRAWLEWVRSGLTGVSDTFARGLRGMRRPLLGDRDAVQKPTRASSGPTLNLSSSSSCFGGVGTPPPRPSRVRASEGRGVTSPPNRARWGVVRQSALKVGLTREPTPTPRRCGSRCGVPPDTPSRAGLDRRKESVRVCVPLGG